VERMYSSYSLRTSALDGASGPSRPGESTPGTRWTRGWLGVKAGLDTDVSGKILLPPPGIEPRSPGCPVRILTELPRLPSDIQCLK
jgi:hypothetical protein